MLGLIMRIKENIKLILASISLGIVAWFTYAFQKRGEQIRELELDKKDKELENKTVKIETEIKEKKEEINETDKTLDGKLSRFDAARKRFRDLKDSIDRE